VEGAVVAPNADPKEGPGVEGCPNAGVDGCPNTGVEGAAPNPGVLVIPKPDFGADDPPDRTDAKALPPPAAAVGVEGGSPNGLLAGAALGVEDPPNERPKLQRVN